MLLVVASGAFPDNRARGKIDILGLDSPGWRKFTGLSEGIEWLQKGNSASNAQTQLVYGKGVRKAIHKANVGCNCASTYPYDVQVVDGNATEFVHTDGVIRRLHFDAIIVFGPFTSHAFFFFGSVKWSYAAWLVATDVIRCSR
jgi:hypothetical protein